MTRSGVDGGELSLGRMRFWFSLLLLPFAIYAFVHSGWMTGAIGDFGEEIWDLFCLSLAIAGLLIRVLDAGYTLPDGKSERLQSGIHSVVRYPLYLANVLIFLSLVLLFKSALFTFLAAITAAIYYRHRIALDDELLSATLDAPALMRATKVPAFFPSFSLWIAPPNRFSWSAVLQREAAPIALVGILFFTIETLEGVVIESHQLKPWLMHEIHWPILMLASGLVFLARLLLFPAVAIAGAEGNIPSRTAGVVSLPEKIGEILDWITATHFRAASVLLIASLFFFLQGFSSLPVTSRDESRFAQPAKQMVETADYVDIRLQGATRYRKPVGVYWLQAGAVKAAEALGVENARNRIEIYRLPSLFAAIGSVLLTYWIALAFVSRRNALLAGLALGASSLVGVEARIATIDASMMLASTASFGALAYIYLHHDRTVSSKLTAWGLAGIFWTGVGCSLLLKGPIIITILGLAIAALVVRERSARWLMRLKPLAGVLWIAVLIAPWYLAIYLQTKGAFFTRSVSGDLMSRLLQPAEGHWGPPGYFWLLFWVSFWPAAILAPQATAFAWINRSDRCVFFLIAWIVPAWIMFELVVTKLPHYVLPLYPGIAILIALMLDRHVVVERRAQFVGLLWPAFAAALALAIGYLAFKFDGPLELEFFGAVVFAVGLASFAAWQFLRGQSETAFVLSLLAAIGSSTALYTALPQMKGLAIARELVAASRAAPCVLPRVAAAGYAEPNLIFYGGTNTLLASAEGAADFLKPDECRVAFVESRQRSAFAERAAALGLKPEKIGEVSGFDYSNWRNSTFDVLIRGRVAR